MELSKYFWILLLALIGQACCKRYRYVADCTEPGLKCADCETLIFCVGTGADTLQRITLKSCNNTEGLYCSVGHGGCAEDHRVCDIFGLSDIDCQDVGLFPDPFDCTSYHDCVDSGGGILVDKKYNCRVGLAYDPLSTICRMKKTDRVCTESPVPDCKKPLQMGALIENPTIYYICVDSDKGLYPRLYRCPNGLLFDAINSICVESLPSTTPIPQEEFQCPSAGVFADPKDCHRYYICSSELKAQHKTCRQGFYFDAKINMCALGFC